jgi:hypothetical protein
VDRHGGLETVSTTHASGDDYVVSEKTGLFTTSAGSYRGQHWHEDANGIVVLLNRFHATMNANALAWRHPDDPAYNVRVIGLTTTAPQEYVLEANPPGGSDQYRYYDAKTFLLDRVVTYSKDRHRHVREYSDYRTVYGETRWFQSAYHDGRPQNDEVEKVVSFQPESGDAVSFAIPESRALFTAGDRPITLPARFTKQGIIVRVNAGSRGLDFLLDTGASDILMDPGVARELGIHGYGRTTETIGGDFDTSPALAPELRVGNLDMHDVAIYLGAIDDRIGDARVVGLLGFDFLANAVSCFDFKAQTVTMYSRAAFAPLSAGFQAMPMIVDDGVPRVSASFENIKGWFLLDTGSFGTILYKDYVRKLPSLLTTETGIGRIGAVGGVVDSRNYAVSDFAFGPVLFRNATVTVPEESTFDVTDYDGIIGRDALSAYNFCLDYTDRAAFFKASG